MKNREIPMDLAFKIYAGFSPSLTIRQILGDEVYCAIVKRSRLIRIKMGRSLAAMVYCLIITVVSLNFTLSIWLAASGIIAFIYSIGMGLLVRIEHLSIDKKLTVINLIKFQEMILSGELKVYKRQIFTPPNSAMPRLKDPSFFGDDLGYVWIFGRERLGLWSKSFDRPAFISLFIREADLFALIGRDSIGVEVGAGFVRQDFEETNCETVTFSPEPLETSSVYPDAAVFPMEGGAQHFLPECAGIERNLDRHGLPAHSAFGGGNCRGLVSQSSELEEFARRVSENIEELIEGEPELIEKYLLEKMQRLSAPGQKLAHMLINYGSILRDKSLSKKARRMNFSSKTDYCEETVRQIMTLKSNVLRGLANSN